MIRMDELPEWLKVLISVLFGFVLVGIFAMMDMFLTPNDVVTMIATLVVAIALSLPFYSMIFGGRGR